MSLVSIWFGPAPVCTVKLGCCASLSSKLFGMYVAPCSNCPLHHAPVYGRGLYYHNYLPSLYNYHYD